MRAPKSYSEASRLPSAPAVGVDVSEPVSGFFRHRLRSGSVIGGVRIWHGPPHDPDTGEVMDRGHRWQAEFDGEPCDFDQCWPQCTGSPITEAEYRALVARREWARRNAPDSAYANVGRKIDLLSLAEPLPF